jgi:hypothetical protein
MDKPSTIRVHERYRLKVSIVVKHSRSMCRIDAELWDLSIDGCRLISAGPLSTGEQLLIKIKGLETWPATVAWVGVDCYGISFHAPLHYSVAEHYARSFPCGSSEPGEKNGSIPEA